jgi:periplasmic divalent cation tolerance protein
MRVHAIQVVTTTAEKQDAETLAQAVLEKRLGACVQISGPIESRYWWNGRIETANEWTLTIKTRRDLFKPLEKLLLELHPYDQPEILATAAAEISAGYLKWLTEQVGGKTKEEPA